MRQSPHIPQIVLLHGAAAAGKYTIARELAALAGFSLFHNHLVVDLLLSLFPFGSAPFVEHRERIWLDLMADAVAAGGSLIFTFNPERTVRPGFPEALRERVERAGGTVRCVEVVCDEGEIERRMESEERREFRKLNSAARYRELKREGAFDYPPLPADCRIDSTSASPRESALRIAEALGLDNGGGG